MMTKNERQYIIQILIKVQKETMESQIAELEDQVKICEQIRAEN
jgi:hypothetical protein